MTRTAPETRSTNVSGAWTIQAFGAVTNPGSADAAQLASDLAVLQAAFQSDFDFVVLYPGGSASTPGIINANTQLLIDNPFRGFAVAVEVEHRIDQQWFNPGWYCLLDRSSSDPYFAWGIRASHNIQTDKIVVVSGKTGTATINQSLSGGLTSAQCLLIKPTHISVSRFGSSRGGYDVSAARRMTNPAIRCATP